jgi:hypothetical protein
LQYFNITKEIDEGFFDIPASCPAKEEDSSVGALKLFRCFSSACLGGFFPFDLFCILGKGPSWLSAVSLFSLRSLAPLLVLDSFVFFASFGFLCQEVL